MLLTVLISLLVISVGLFIFAIYKDDTKEKMTRLSFLGWVLFVGVGNIILSKLFESYYLSPSDLVPVVFLLIIAYPFGRAFSRRSRDAGWSKTPAYCALIPVVGFVITIALIFKGPAAKQYDGSKFGKVER
tara:strand:+ start:120 stop:512 length:393 start_codon:yes stop_codon:yes gene_type:complete